MILLMYLINNFTPKPCNQSLHFIMKLVRSLTMLSLAGCSFATAATPIFDDLSSKLWTSTLNSSRLNADVNTITNNSASALYNQLSGKNTMTWYYGSKDGAYGGIGNLASTDSGLSFNMEFPKVPNGMWMGTKSDILSAGSFNSYDKLTFSLNVATASGATNKGVSLFANLYYQAEGSNTLTLLGGQTVQNITSVSQNLSFDLSADAMNTLNQAGQIYVVLGDTSGTAWSQLAITDMTFTGMMAPEPASAMLGLLGLAGMAWRRRRCMA